MEYFDLSMIQSWDRFYRGNFINSLSGIKSASLIGTVDEDGINNLAIFSNIVHLGADPALIGFINRPLAASKDTFTNIQRNKYYTVNTIHNAIIEQAHQTSAKYDSKFSEFEAVGLEPEFLNDFNAPFVKESKIKYALEHVQTIPIELNNTYFVIGKIVAAYLPKEIITEDGFIQHEKVNSMGSLGIDGYYNLSFENRFAYAKPNQPTKSIIK
jgi:flavin reductase (DIM6/NTAB) family NADH-FMN oxidoreductase RutF